MKETKNTINKKFSTLLVEQEKIMSNAKSKRNSKTDFVFNTPLNWSKYFRIKLFINQHNLNN